MPHEGSRGSSTMGASITTRLTARHSSNPVRSTSPKISSCISSRRVAATDWYPYQIDLTDRLRIAAAVDWGGELMSRLASSPNSHHHSCLVLSFTQSMTL